MAKAMLSYKYRLYPNKTQLKQLDRVFSMGWRVYNDIINTSNVEYERGVKFDAHAIRDLFCAQRHTIEALQILPATTIDDLVRRYHKALKAFWQQENVGFPKEKKRRDFTGLGYVYGNGIKFIPESEKVARLRLFKVDGLIRVQYHRPLPEGWVIKHVVITVDGGKWNAVLQLQGKAKAVPLSTKPTVGIDMGLVHLLALSDGAMIDHPRWYTQVQDKRTRYQQWIDQHERAWNPQNYAEDGSKKKGVFIWRRSDKCYAVKRLLRKLERKAKEQRWYFWHTVTDYLTKTYGLIVLERLKLDFMIQNSRLSRDTHDAGLGMFRRMLEEKAQQRGVRIEYVDAAYTSQTCHQCGHIARENRPTRDTFRCVSCGHQEHADLNAAKNVLNRAQFRAVQTLDDTETSQEVETAARNPKTEYPCTA